VTTVKRASHPLIMFAMSIGGTMSVKKKAVEGKIVEAGENSDVNDLVVEVENAQVPGKGKWLSLNKTPRTQNSYQRKINELEQQVKVLANRPNIFELDEAEVTAIAGEDAAILIRAAKSKAQTVLADAERNSQSLKDQAAAELRRTKKIMDDLIKTRESEADQIRIKSIREAEAVKKEAADILTRAKSDASRTAQEADLRAKELLDRAILDAKEESRRILTEINNERKRFIERLAIQKDLAQKASAQASKVRRDLINSSNTLKASLDQAMADWTELDQKAQGAAEKLANVQEGINS
jgi:chromosome segregation ATPase